VPKLIAMVGLPGSGKTTYASKHYPDIKRLSTDDVVEAVAKELRVSYTDIHKYVMPYAMGEMDKAIAEAQNANCDILWDQTNLTPKKRKWILTRFPSHYKVAVHIISHHENLKARNEERRLHGRSIPWNIITNMLTTSKPPTKEEGWDEIIEVET